MCQFITQCIFLISSWNYSYLPHFHFSHGGEIFLGEIMLRKLINMLTWQTVKWNFCETEFINHLINLILKPSLDLLLRWELVLFFSIYLYYEWHQAARSCQRCRTKSGTSTPIVATNYCSSSLKSSTHLLSPNELQ